METFFSLAAIINVFCHALLYDLEPRGHFPNACTKENSKKPAEIVTVKDGQQFVCVSLKSGTEEQKNSVRKSITPLAFFVYKCQLSMQENVLPMPKVCFCACASDYRFLPTFDPFQLGSHTCSTVTYFCSMLWPHIAEFWRLYAKKYTNNISSHGRLE